MELLVITPKEQQQQQKVNITSEVHNPSADQIT